MGEGWSAMIHGLPLLALILLAMLVLLAFWRLVLMIVAAASLALLVLGLMQTITWLGDVL